MQSGYGVPSLLGMRSVQERQKKEESNKWSIAGKERKGSSRRCFWFWIEVCRQCPLLIDESFDLLQVLLHFVTCLNQQACASCGRGNNRVYFIEMLTAK
ncbi:Uncharacterized protein TCM_010407 [Theobroma cacao]|uniref:Uncharacterized protein n=1 Tax=Theobroma cacao TaxID=3641 RepID=A0A061E828_THECC|nr:Uncharacterized protein TCM_010407 [Theobroma cacao]